MQPGTSDVAAANAPPNTSNIVAASVATSDIAAANVATSDVAAANVAIVHHRPGGGPGRKAGITREPDNRSMPPKAELT